MTEESSLDDFFARKDRNKKKQKNKNKQSDALTPTEDFSIPTTIQSNSYKKDKDRSLFSTARSNTPVEGLEETEEWHDFEDKTEKDYSGLRIQNIQISKRVDSENESDQRDGGDDENGENGGDKDDSTSGPWNKNIVTDTPMSEPVSVQAPIPSKLEEPKGPKKYVPPNRRYANQQPQVRGMGPRKKKTAPDLKNEEEFPTLGSAPAAEWAASQSKTFECVRSGSKPVENTDNTCMVELENQYAALS